MAMMSKDGLSKLELGSEKRRKGDGSGGEGLIKLSRSSLKNLDGGGASVRASSMAACFFFSLFSL